MKQAVGILACALWIAPATAFQTHVQFVTRGQADAAGDQVKAVHHFFLHDDGGTINLIAADPADDAAVQVIRLHVLRMAGRFNDGNFDLHELPSTSPSPRRVMHAGHSLPAPAAAMHATHTSPLSGPFLPGVAGMSRHKAQITYTFVATGAGGRIDIRAIGAAPIQAVHDHLRFLISEHRTGNVTTVTPRAK